jgi:hypothetical protein
MPLMMIAFFLTFISIFKKSNSNRQIINFNIILWAAFISRGVLLIFVDISAFPAFNENYLLTVFPLTTILIFISFIHFNYFKRRLK